jgi:hypothetical protein
MDTFKVPDVERGVNMAEEKEYAKHGHEKHWNCGLLSYFPVFRFAVIWPNLACRKDLPRSRRIQVLISNFLGVPDGQEVHVQFCNPVERIICRAVWSFRFLLVYDCIVNIQQDVTFTRLDEHVEVEVDICTQGISCCS